MAHYFRDKARYWSKIAIFLYTPAFDVPARRSPSEYCYNVRRKKKLEWRGYPIVEKFNMFNRFDAIPGYDGQTDSLRQHSLGLRAMHSIAR